MAKVISTHKIELEHDEAVALTLLLGALNRTTEQKLGLSDEQCQIISNIYDVLSDSIHPDKKDEG